MLEQTNISSNSFSGLRKARKAAGMTQKQLAESLYVERTTISSIETGRTLPSLPLAREICKVLNCTWDIFFDYDFNTDEKVRKEFEIYMNFKNNSSKKTAIAESETLKLEKTFLDIIGIEHSLALDNLVSNIMCIWLECGFEAGYTAKRKPLTAINDFPNN